LLFLAGRILFPVVEPVLGRESAFIGKPQGKTLMIEDPCAMGLRVKNLPDFPWLSCQRPNRKAATTDHWPKPPGCEEE
jgi:hypothetical protein